MRDGGRSEARGARRFCLGLALWGWMGAAGWSSDSAFPDTPRTEDGYKTPTTEVELAFPRDHGSHPGFRTEWWYLVGHLEASGGGEERFGFQLTFFRSAAEGGARQLYLAHAAVSDLREERHVHEERLNRDTWNAKAQVGRMDLYNGNWSLAMEESAERMEARFSVKGDYVTRLELEPLKPPTLFGDGGVSRKGEDRFAASYYVTFTRIRVAGTMEIGGRRIEVDGLAWMDHEFSSSQLSAGQIGWNWTSLMLEDGTELMAYVMRREDGEVDPYSKLSLIGADGELRELGSGEFRWTPLRYWESAESAARYPVDYEIVWEEAGGSQRRIEVRAAFDEQEMAGEIGRFVYWEGACFAFDEEGKRMGKGYTELTGYAESLYGRF